MPVSATRFIKRCAQWRPKSDARLVPGGTRGVYALLHYRPRANKFDVVYIGMAPRGGVLSRLRSHKRSANKVWTHFSIFEVWDNISEEEVHELEGLFREIYRKDQRANRFNKQKKCKRLQKVRKDDLASWKNQVVGV
jgi:hypothetical protein